MIDDEFVKNFLETDPNYQHGIEGLPDKPSYTRAEVDEIVQRTIKSTLEAMQTATASEPEEEKEENADGREETAGEEPAGENE